MNKSLIALITVFIFTVFTVAPSWALAETIHLEGGTVDVNVQDHITSVGVTGNPVWNLPEFNVAQGSTYNLTGLSAGASLAMLVNGGQASNIFGTMNISNLAFILQNIFGIHVGNTGLINLNNASFIASTIPMNLSMTNFLAQQYQFSGQGGFLSNEGRILGGKGDLVALVANAIENKGTIEVPMGTVALAAGKTVTIGLDQAGLISVGVDEATANAMGLKDQIKNTGTIQANGGRVVLDAKAVDGLFEKAINIAKEDNATGAVIADDGKIEFVTEGDVRNMGNLQAKRGKIEMDVKGDVETMGNLEAAYFREKAATFRIGGDYHVGQSFHDNLDNAITYAVNTHVSGTINDVANIVINAGIVITLDADTTFKADSDHGEVGDGATGAFLMDPTAEIVGGDHDLVVYASDNSTFGKIGGIKNMTLNAYAGDTVSYRVGNIVTMSGNLIVNTGATLTGGYSVTVSGGSVTGNGTINMTGGIFNLVGEGTFGGNTDWTFWELYFGDGTTQGTTSKTGSNKVTALTELKIKLNHTLAAGSSTWDLSWGGGYLTDVIQIVAGDEHSLALLSNGTVMAWGLNNYGQLGDGTTTNRPAAVYVWSDGTMTSYLTGVKQIAAGSYHSLALLASGAVVAWGYNANGRLGDGTTTNRSTPVSVYSDATKTAYLSGVIQIVAGYAHSMAILSNGTADTTDDTVKAWGANGSGQLGDGTKTQRTTPVSVYSDETKTSLLTGVIQIAAGWAHSLALLSNGTVKAWGTNSNGELGDGLLHETTQGDLLYFDEFDNPVYAITDLSSTPVSVNGLSDVIQIAAGQQHSLALLSNGTVKAWGVNLAGRLGDGTEENRSTPVSVYSDATMTSYLTGVTKIAAGRLNSFAILGNGTADTSDDTVKAWGVNTTGGWFSALGDGTNEIFRSTPVSVWSDATMTSPLTGVTQIAGGYLHSLGLLSSGRVASWGEGINGKLGNNSISSATTPVWTTTAVDAYIRLSDISRIVSGGNHTLALKSDGSRVYAWGYNYYGELGDGTLFASLTPVEVRGEDGIGYLTGVLDIAAGYGHSMALLSNGTADTSDDTVMAWGYNGYGQLGDGTTTSRSTPVPVYSDETQTTYLSGVKQIAAGYYHSLALLSNGTADTSDDTVKAWGNNDYGQLGDGTTESRSTPVSVYSDATKTTYLTDVTQIAAGWFHSLALLANGTTVTSDDTVKTWGANWYGQLGDGTTEDHSTPVSVYEDATMTSYLTGVKQIAAGQGYSLALLSNGTADTSDDTVKAWGNNERGQLGDGTTVDKTTPVSVYADATKTSLLTGVTQIAAGGVHAFALLSNGTADTSDDTVKAWGSNGYGLAWYRSGQLGDGSQVDRTTPVSVYSDDTRTSYLTGVAQINAGYYHSVALLSNGTTDISDDTVKAWGYNSKGQLGINSDVLTRTPEDVVILSHAPFTNEGTVDYQRSTFMYTSAYTFEQVILTTVANEPYYNLVLKYTLDNYILETDPARTAKTPSEQDLYEMIMPGGNLTLLGEQKTLPKIDLAAAQKALADRDAAAKAFAAMMEARIGDRMLTPDFFSQFFDSARAMNFITDVRVREGAVYTIDGVSSMSLLTQGESLSVPFKEKKAALARPQEKEPEAKPIQSAPEPPMVTGGNQPEASPREELLFGTHKPAPPVVAGHDEGAGRYGTLKNPGKDVFVQCPGGEWQSAKDGMVIMPGDVVKTAETGSVEVMLDGGKVGRVEIKEGSLFRIRKAETDPTTGDKTTLLELAIGKLIAHVEKLQGKSKFEVKSPTVLTGVRGTVFEVTVCEKA